MSHLTLGIFVFGANFWRNANDELDGRETLCSAKDSQVFEVSFWQSFGQPKPPSVSQEACNMGAFVCHFSEPTKFSATSPNCAKVNIGPPFHH
jgi:hypothetical protein